MPIKRNENLRDKYECADKEMRVRGLDIESFIRIVQRHSDDLSNNFLREYNRVMHPYIVRNTEIGRIDQGKCSKSLSDTSYKDFFKGDSNGRP